MNVLFTIIVEKFININTEVAILNGILSFGKILHNLIICNILA